MGVCFPKNREKPYVAVGGGEKGLVMKWTLTSAVFAGAVVLVTLLAFVSLLSKATAVPDDGEQDGSKTSGPKINFACTKVTEGEFDPIRDHPNAHLHEFIGNTSVNPDSTHQSLLNHPDTSCAEPAATSSYWFPATWDGTQRNQVRKVSVYYAGKADQTEVKPLPEGATVIGDEDRAKVNFRCGDGPPQKTPPVGCTRDEFRIQVFFPDCWNRNGLDPNDFRSRNNGACPEGFGYRFPEIHFGIRYHNPDGFEGPLKVAAGDGTTEPYTHMHGDVMDGWQRPRFEELHRDCIVNVGDNQATPDECISSMN